MTITKSISAVIHGDQGSLTLDYLGVGANFSITARDGTQEVMIPCQEPELDDLIAALEQIKEAIAFNREQG